MKGIVKFFVLLIICLPIIATAGGGYKITGRSGITFFVAIDANQKNNEDIYRFAVGKACVGKAICQVQYWVGNAPSAFPLTDVQVSALATELKYWTPPVVSKMQFFQPI